MTVGISVLSLALLFEVYGDVPLGPFLGVLFYEFARFPASVHGCWKVVCRQELVVLRKKK
jgi:hypothetical protein